MDMKRIEAIAFDQMGNRKDPPAREPGWLYYHGVRAGNIALRLATRLRAGVDRDVLSAGALFHDIGKGKPDHNEVGAKLTAGLLSPHCSEVEREQICEIVRLHNQRHLSSDHALAVRIMQDADALDHFGPIGPWLAIYWSGTHGESAQAHVDYITGEKNRRYRESIRRALNFGESVAMFDERVRWEDEFFKTFRRTYFDGRFPLPRNGDTGAGEGD